MFLTHIGPNFYRAQKRNIDSKWVSQPYFSVTRCVMLIASFHSYIQFLLECLQEKKPVIRNFKFSQIYHLTVVLLSLEWPYAHLTCIYLFAPSFHYHGQSSWDYQWTALDRETVFFSKYLNVNKYQTEVIIVLTFAVKGYILKELVQNSVWNSLYNLRPYKFVDPD